MARRTTGQGCRQQRGSKQSLICSVPAECFMLARRLTRSWRNFMLQNSRHYRRGSLIFRPNDIRSVVAGDHIDVDGIDWALRSIRERATGSVMVRFLPLLPRFYT